MHALNTWADLQALVGTTSEGADLDFKENLDPKERIEFAKDAAALANVLGGHVLVGVSTDLNCTRCKGFHGIKKSEAADVAKAFEEQIKQRCRPVPIFSVRVLDIPQSENVVLVVAVEGSPLAPIGISLKQPEGGRLVDEGWAFPIRVGSLTRYLEPDQFGAYEAMTARRVAALLNSIPQSERKRVILRWVVGPAVPDGEGYGDGLAAHFESKRVIFNEIDIVGNAASFTDHYDNQTPIFLPLDQIHTAWRKTVKGEPSWELRLIGSLHRGEDAWELWPPSS